MNEPYFRYRLETITPSFELPFDQKLTLADKHKTYKQLWCDEDTSLTREQQYFVSDLARLIEQTELYLPIHKEMNDHVSDIKSQHQQIRRLTAAKQELTNKLIVSELKVKVCQKDYQDTQELLKKSQE